MLLANLLGAAIFAALAVMIGPTVGIIGPRAFDEIAKPRVHLPGWTILLSGLLAGG